MYDVAIIGAGPAGSTLARLLGSRYRVLLVDRRRLDAPQLDAARFDERGHVADKLCGGLLSPAAQRELARQGLGVPASVATGPQLFAVRCVDRDSGIERLYQRHYLNVDRAAFDRWLAEGAASHAECRFGWTLAAMEHSAGAVHLRFSTGNGSAGAAARCVIGADGAASVVRRHAFPGGSRHAPYVAVQGAFDSAGEEPWFGALFDSALTDFYGWTVPKGAHTLAGIALPRGPGAPAAYARFVETVRELGMCTGRQVRLGAAPLVRPSRRSELLLGGERILLAGEAAGFVSPSSAEGIGYALRSAAVLAQALEPGLDGAVQRYRDAAAPLALELAGKARKARIIGSPAVRAAMMRSGVASMPRGSDGFSGTVSELLAW